MILILRDKVAVLQALASTVNRVSRNFRFLYLTANNTFNVHTSLLFTIKLLWIWNVYLEIIQSLYVTNEESKPFQFSD